MTSTEAHPHQKLVFGLSVAFAVAITIASVWILFHPHWLAQFRSWGYFGAFVINAISSATLVLPVPGAALVLAMSTELNPWWLSIVSGVGSAVGELTGYFAGATGQRFIPDSQRPTMDRLHVLTEKYGALLLIVLAAYPFPLFDMAGIVAGASKMHLWKFVTATALGKAIKYAFLIALGAAPLEVLMNWINTN
jgi:membrane protein YqaA with SNARE-associated domain